MPISPTTGVALGAIFGTIFVFTCIISAIKAVRDRKKIKKRIAERERRTGGSNAKNGKFVSSIEEGGAPCPSSSKSNKNVKHTNGRKTPAQTQSVSVEKLEILEHKTKKGVDNLTYAHSHSDIKQRSNGDYEQPSKSKYSAERETPPRNGHARGHARSTRSVSNDVVERRGGSQLHLNDISPECLAVRKILRRHSYDMAVCEHSWLPMDPPTFQTSNKIIQTYSYARSSTNGFARPSSNGFGTVGFENRAFNTEDYRNT